MLGTSVTGVISPGKKIEGIVTGASHDSYQIESQDNTTHWVKYQNVSVVSQDVPPNARVGVEYRDISGEGVLVSSTEDTYTVLMDGARDPVQVPKYCAVELSELVGGKPVENGDGAGVTPSSRKKSKKRKSVGDEVPQKSPELVKVKEEPVEHAVESTAPTPEPTKKRKKVKTPRSVAASLPPPTPDPLTNRTPQRYVLPPSMGTPTPPAPSISPYDSIRKRKSEELNIREESLLGQDVYVLIEGKLLLCRVTDTQQQKVRVNWYKANSIPHAQCQQGCKLPAHKTLTPTDSYSWIDEVNILPMKVHILDDVSLQHTYYLRRE
eukprot:TRINITY_DN42993_c0_g1_i1.p1 TRINITY_DN42993_c0_g1~~TRINITY_DN42993_c0_g1_i1.p1  ORF type:complete len:323 (+),score=47.67 TRINITY_DN42993_c0_g1_i1:279-1247(+)